MDGLIRKLMPPMLLVMWGGLGWLWWNGLLAGSLGLGLAISHLLCLIIFYHFVYVFNYGYAVTMIVLPLIYAYSNSPSTPALMLISIYLAYGLRMTIFSWRRYRAPSYAERAQRAHTASRSIPVPVKIITWIFTSALMFYISFIAWVVISSDKISAMVWPAMLVTVTGLVIESVADDEKQRTKAADKDARCITGLYRRIRHPNFLGEIIFHLGLFWTLLSAATEAYMIVLGAFGTVWLLILMINEAFTYDDNQMQRYGKSVTYREWRDSTGLLLPKF